MRPAGSLERGYLRLLRCYPAGHRDVHGEEMLGVLLAGARPGQRRPGLAESASLICGRRAHPAARHVAGLGRPLA